MLFRESSIQGRLVNVRAADDLGRWVTLESGRLPARCVPAHCEVLRLEGSGPIPSTPYLRLIEVGRAKLKPDAPFAPFVLPAPHTEQVARAVRYHTPQPSPVVIANGVAGLSRTKELETFYRAYAWFQPVSAGDVHPWSLDAFAARVRHLTAQLATDGEDSFQVSSPTDALTTTVADAHVASRRLLLLGGEGGALLLAFTILTASALRRDVAAARRRLTWFGARRFQVELHTLVEALVPAATGTLAGFAVGGGVAALVASRAGSPAGAVDRVTPCSRRRPRDRCRDRSGRRPAPLCHRPRAGGAARAPRGHAARRRGGRGAGGRPDRLGTRVGRRVGTRRRRRDEHVRAARSRTDRLRRRGRGGTRAGAGAADARPRGPARADLAAARGGVAGAKPGPRRRRRHVPRRESRPRALRRRVPLDAAGGPARRGALRRPGALRALGGPRAARPRAARSRAEARRRPPASCASRGTFRPARPSASSRCPRRRSRASRAGAPTSRPAHARRSPGGSRRGA